MEPTGAVRRLPRRMAEDAAHEIQVECVEERAVVEHAVPPHPQGVARDLHAARRRPDGGRLTAWLSLVSFGVLTLSILWGIFGPTRHGMPPTPPPRAAQDEAAA